MLEEADMAEEYLNKQRVEGQEEIAQKITERIEEQRTEEKKRKTEESRYNDTYKKIRTEEMPKYLKGKKSKKDKSRIGRYRHYWKEETEGECRICGKGQESLKHVLKECEATKDKITMEKFLSEEENGLNIMRKIDKIQEEKKIFIFFHSRRRRRRRMKSREPKKREKEKQRQEVIRIKYNNMKLEMQERTKTISNNDYEQQYEAKEAKETKDTKDKKDTQNRKNY